MLACQGGIVEWCRMRTRISWDAALGVSATSTGSLFQVKKLPSKGRSTFYQYTIIVIIHISPCPSSLRPLDFGLESVVLQLLVAFRFKLCNSHDIQNSLLFTKRAVIMQKWWSCCHLQHVNNIWCVDNGIHRALSEVCFCIFFARRMPASGCELDWIAWGCARMKCSLCLPWHWRSTQQTSPNEKWRQQISNIFQRITLTQEESSKPFPVFQTIVPPGTEEVAGGFASQMLHPGVALYPKLFKTDVEQDATLNRNLYWFIIRIFTVCLWSIAVMFALSFGVFLLGSRVFGNGRLANSLCPGASATRQSSCRTSLANSPGLEGSTLWMLRIKANHPQVETQYILPGWSLKLNRQTKYCRSYRIMTEGFSN